MCLPGAVLGCGPENSASTAGRSEMEVKPTPTVSGTAVVASACLKMPQVPSYLE